MDVARVQLPQERVQDLIQCAQLFEPSVSLRARTFLRLLGLIAACLTAVPQVSFHMRKIQLQVSQSLQHRVLVPPSLTPHFAQAKWHINCQEMMTLKEFVYLLKGKCINIRTDNIAVKQHINKEGGTKSISFCQLALELLSWTTQNKMSLTAEHVPGVQNTLADTLCH